MGHGVGHPCTVLDHCPALVAAIHLITVIMIHIFELFLVSFHTFVSNSLHNTTYLLTEVIKLASLVVKAKSLHGIHIQQFIQTKFPSSLAWDILREPCQTCLLRCSVAALCAVLHRSAWLMKNFITIFIKLQQLIQRKVPSSLAWDILCEPSQTCSLHRFAMQLCCAPLNTTLLCLDDDKFDYQFDWLGIISVNQARLTCCIAL